MNTVQDYTESEYQAALATCRQAGQIRTSTIMRALGCGYVKACLLIEAMGERGIAERVDPNGRWVFRNRSGCCPRQESCQSPPSQSMPTRPPGP